MLITPAYAQAAAGGDANSMLMSLLPFALIFVIMYFLILRPQQKKVKDHSDRACGLPVRGSEFLPTREGEDLAGVGATPHRARSRSAGRFVPAARSRFQLRKKGKARSGARRSSSRAARGQDRLYRPFRA